MDYSVYVFAYQQKGIPLLRFFILNPVVKSKIKNRKPSSQRQIYYFYLIFSKFIYQYFIVVVSFAVAPWLSVTVSSKPQVASSFTGASVFIEDLLFIVSAGPEICLQDQSTIFPSGSKDFDPSSDIVALFVTTQEHNEINIISNFFKLLRQLNCYVSPGNCNRRFVGR